ncbi:hypothetical protein LCGC14_0471810 [marine sediment metagenome]|uniref:Uncharacterized protein n=1 Tax=marine sediment metagenome TaxID=412755 RepID=A0A0F9SBX1_9ZZZZ
MTEAHTEYTIEEGWPNTNRLPRYKAPKGVGTVLGVPVSHLVIPEHLWVRIRHLHAGNSTKNERRRATFMTVVEVISIATGKVHGIWKASPRNGDAPNRARGLQVALGGAIIRAMAADEGLPWMKRKSGHWPEAAMKARALQDAFGAPVRYVFGNPDHVYKGVEDVSAPAPTRAPDRAPARETFKDKDLIVKTGKGVDVDLRKGIEKAMAKGIENDIQEALDSTQEVEPGNAAEDARHPVRMSHPKLTAGQCLQVEVLLNKHLRKNTTIIDWVLYDYMVRGRNVVGFIMLNPSIPESQL